MRNANKRDDENPTRTTAITTPNIVMIYPVVFKSLSGVTVSTGCNEHIKSSENLEQNYHKISLVVSPK